MSTFEKQNLGQEPEHLITQPESVNQLSRLKNFWPKLKWLFLFSLFGFIIWLIYVYFFQEVSFLSPLAMGRVLSSRVEKPLADYQAIGFLPYWSVNRGTEIPWQVLDEVIFFDLSVDGRGNIGRSDQDQVGGRAVLESSKFVKLQKEAQETNTRLGLALTCFNDQEIKTLLKSDRSIDNFLSQLEKILNNYNFDTINIDFEFVGLNQPESVKNNFNQLISQIKTRFPNKKISFDIYANAVIKNRPYDIRSLGRIVDQMIIMAYDFHRPSSENSGPIAPINQPYASARSITEALRESFKLISPQKTVLGVPLYGYEWPTYSQDIYANPTEQGVMASFSRTHDLIAEKDLAVQWDNQSLSPWLSYEDDSGRIKQIYFENLYSLSLKYQLVKQAQLAGVAYWALGYEGDYTDVWQEAEVKLKNI